MKTLARQRDSSELLRRLEELRPDSARRWGTMSSHQMVCHLIDAFHMMTGQKVVSGATGLLQQTLLKWTALYLPFRWPSGILTRPEIDQAFDGRRPGDFTADVNALETLVRFAAVRDRHFHWPQHPIFGRMSETAWLRWAYLHTDHHFRQFGI